ncbi:thioesterase [Paraferrimonas haliotis]|uniref:Thioesterase n=2 Tax=Paraferrimonas haliotis TaxID=2013866 RepID=A0AA37TKI9_9GAMM|nr:thioesterase [Paraferrimonas haliotis]
MTLVANAQVRVPFQDCDPMRVVWHGNYFRYLELGREALLAELDFDYREMERQGYAFPVVDTRMKFVASAVYGDALTIQSRLDEWENRLKISYRITRDSDGATCIKAHTIHCAVGLEDGQMRFASPQCLLSKVQVWQESQS